MDELQDEGTGQDETLTFFKVIRREELVEGQGKLVRAGIKKLAVFLHEGNLYCIQNFCPHAGGFLALGEVKGCVVKCPRHNWGFDFRTGDCLTNPRYDVRRYPVREEEGWVLVGVSDDHSAF